MMVKRILLSGFLLAGLCLFYGFFVEPKMLVVRNITVHSQNWYGPPLRIALISDIHIGGVHVDARRVEGIVDKMNGLSPDIVLLAGDYVSGHTVAQERSEKFNKDVTLGLTKLGGLRAPLGVYAVIGNHDDWYGGERVRSVFEKIGIGVLENQAANIQLSAHNFCLLGFADAMTGAADEAVSAGCMPEADQIALMHSPDSFPLMDADTALALAGHTHGGQINIPFIGRRVTSTKIGRQFAYGQVRYNDIPAFVTAGIGTSILPARFRARPEIVLITLRQQKRVSLQPAQPAQPK